ncbi:hypothetical protein EIN_059500 [Entamoeba invadens IP1]|uniref:hypothetical protein n=1 Tax=Entamoeba invadens IP1 TaxID=370355 RepID=UPI0002C3F468|nr:hypothetical protein EIN_059500 [Entamoeba invadens IP1]ELP93465.1 hypothetical protein EIN_059500 [Entamoeba invadens IP1]|eukprot:XP_004260236.1 hypothetical protein EIN_059500 [Entamoeba invadens IP1]
MGRFKLYKKFVGFYKVYCGLKEPIHVYTDSTFIIEANNRSIWISNQFEKIFEGHPKIYLTSCVLAELVGQKLPPHQVVQCTHQKMDAKDCFMSHIKASGFDAPMGKAIPFNIVIASMDSTMLTFYRNTRFPLFTFEKQIMKFCPPSYQVRKRFKEIIKLASKLTEDEKKAVQEGEEALRRKEREKNKEELGAVTHMRGLVSLRKALGPNPLSIKKRATKPTRRDDGTIKKVRRGTRGNTKQRKIRRALNRLAESKQPQKEENGDLKLSAKSE